MNLEVAVALRHTLKLEIVLQSDDPIFIDSITRDAVEVDPILRPGKRKVKLAWSRAWV
jgi:hypothetical protein